MVSNSWILGHRIIPFCWAIVSCWWQRLRMLPAEETRALMEVSHDLIASLAHVAEHTSYPAVRRQADSATLSHSPGPAYDPPCCKPSGERPHARPVRRRFVPGHVWAV